MVLAFRGTADLRNWLTDLDWPKIPLYWAAGKVHRGFNTALESVAEQLDAAIHPEDPRRLWITGHSLGGALAMLFALRLKIRRGREVAGVYTFGQPRLGNIPFSLGYDDALKARTFRVVHAEDIVPRVPWLLGSYRHAGHEVFYRPSPLLLPGGEGGRRPDEGKPWQLNPPWWAKGSSDLFGLWSEWRWAGRVALFNAHHVSRYVEMLTGVAASRQSAADFGSSPRAGYGGCLPTAATQARSQTD